MSALRNINQVLALLPATARQMLRWRIWLLLLSSFGLQWLALLALNNFASGPLAGLVISYVSLLGPAQAEAFTHYPEHFLILGQAAGWIKSIIGLLIEGPILGATAILFCRYMGGDTSSGKTHEGRSVFFLAINFMLAWLVMNGLMTLIGMYLPTLVEPIFNSPRRLLVLGFVVLPAIFTLTFGVLFLTIPAIAISGKSLVGALGLAVRKFLARPFSMFFLAGLVLAGPILLGAIVSRPEVIIDRFRPELIYWLLVTSLALEVVANFFWMGTAVRFLLDSDD